MSPDRATTETPPAGGDMDTRALALECARVLYDRKGEDIKILDVRDSLAISDFFLIVTGRNRRHLRSMADELRKVARAHGMKVPREEGGGSDDESRWVLLDLGDIVVHLFGPETRAFYDLDALWADAPQVKWSA